MRRRIGRTLYAATAAGITLTLTALGFAGAAAPAAAATPSLSPPVYSTAQSGYASSGRWFRFAAATVTVLPPGGPTAYCGMFIVLRSSAMPSSADAVIQIAPGSGGVQWGNPSQMTPFGLRPNAGDQLRASIYYDRQGHTFFTADDLTQGITRSVRVQTGDIVYDQASLVNTVMTNGIPPATGIRLWQVTGTRLTTYTGVRGTVTGPWQTSPVIETSSGTAAGTVLSSPTGLWDGGADFSIWLRALPLAYTQGLAGYDSSGGPFRFIVARMTVPAAQVPAANGGTALVTLGHNGGPTPRPYAAINVSPGGGAGSISYISNTAAGTFATGTFTVNPKPGDQLAVSIFYDQHGHYSLTVTDSTQAATQTVTVPAPLADSMALNSAGAAVELDNSAVTPPPADIQLWEFSIGLTTYSGEHGSILGPWASTETIDTTDGTAAGGVVASATTLGTGSDFSVWLRHQ
jgi:hypothetical protein